MDDETLLRRYAREGDEAAFRELARRYGGLVYASCLRDLHHSELAEDAAQAVFLVLARKAGRLRVRTTLVPWLVATARMVSRGVRRAERRRPTVSLDETVPAPDPLGDDSLFQALDALGAPEREAVVLRFVQGLSLAEVGHAQGVSEDAARMRVNRALKRLRMEYVPALAAPASLTERLATLPLPKPVPMLIPPLFTAAGVAVVAGGTLGAAALQRPQTSAPALRPPVQKKAAPKTVLEPGEPAYLADLKPAKPGPTPPAIPTLKGPFTLVYRLAVSDVRTDAMRAAAVEARRKELAADVDADKMTQAQADAQIALMTGPRVTSTFTITLAYDGKTLFYEDRPDGGTDPNPTTNLFDGQNTYSFWTPRTAGTLSGQGSREDGTVQYWTWHMPYVGPSMPFFPVTQGGQIISLSGFDRKLIYRPWGRIETGPGGVVKHLWMGRFDPQEEIVFSRWQKIHGTAVAGSIVDVWPGYAPYLARKDQGKPSERRTYTLISASPTADPALFDLDHYLSNGDPFDLPAGNGPARRFLYDRSKGTLRQQIADFLGGGH